MAIMIKVTITINKPVEKVRELFVNPDNVKHWLTGFVSSEHISGHVGETGSVSKLKFLERGKLVEVKEIVMAATPNQQYTLEMEHNSFQAKTDYTLSFIWKPCSLQYD